MVGEEDALLSSETYAMLSSESFPQPPSSCFVQEIVDKLQQSIQVILSERLQVLNTNVMGQLQQMSQEMLSQQDAAFQRLAEAVKPHVTQKECLGRATPGQKHIVSTRSEKMCGRSVSLPEELPYVKTQSQKDRYRNLVNHARSGSRKATAQRLRLLHTDQLLRKPDKSPTECTIASCPSAIMRTSRSSIDEPKRSLGAMMQPSRWNIDEIGPSVSAPKWPPGSNMDEANPSVSALTLPSTSNMDKANGSVDKGRKTVSFNTCPEAEASFKGCSNQERKAKKGPKEEIDNQAESAAGHSRQMEGAQSETDCLPGSVQDDENFSHVLPSSSNSIKKMRDLRAETEASIVARNLQNMYREGSQAGDVIVQAHCKRTTEYLRKIWGFWGIVSLSSHMCAQWYRRVVIFCAGCAMVHSIFELVLSKGGLFESIANLSMYVCVFLNLVFLRHMGNLVGPFEDQFTEYATSHGFLHEWGNSGMLRLLFTAAVWAAVACLMCVPSGMKTADGYSVILMAWRDGLLLAILHCLWQVLAFLELMVDSYCIEFLERLDCQWGVSSWNGLQALLRRVAEAVENCFLVVQSAIIVALLCCTGRLVIISLERTNGLKSSGLADLTPLLRVYAPLLLIGLVALVLFAKAACVTAKCSEVAPLVNSVTIEEDQEMDNERQYLVSYIIQSDAGFYVKGTRFTAAMLLKSCYLFGTIICGLGTASLSIGRQN